MPNGRRITIDYDTNASQREPGHALRSVSDDPNGIVRDMRDPYFFTERFAPVTTHMAFISADVSTVVTALGERAKRINAEWQLPWEVKVETVEGRLADKLTALLPLTSIRSTKTLLTETRSEWTGYMANGFPRGDVHIEPEYLSSTLRTRCVVCVVALPMPGIALGSIQFAHYDGRSEAVAARTVYVHKETRWSFEEHGSRLPFEDIEAYASSRVRDRLVPETVERYCNELGIRLFDDEFYCGKGHVIHTYPPPGAQYFPSFPAAKSA